jgi:biopolymer transport protein ExbD
MAAKLSGSGGGKYDIGQNNEINVTPFVDVMLVLLIIFMVAAPLSTVSVEVKLPDAYAKAQQNPPKPIYISIQKNGHMYVGDYPTTLDDLATDLKKSLPPGKRQGDERIFIRGDGDVMYQDFMRLMDKLQDNGYYSVALIGRDAAGATSGSQ